MLAFVSRLPETLLATDQISDALLSFRKDALRVVAHEQETKRKRNDVKNARLTASRKAEKTAAIAAAATSTAIAGGSSMNCSKRSNYSELSPHSRKDR